MKRYEIWLRQKDWIFWTLRPKWLQDFISRVWDGWCCSNSFDL